MKRYGMLFVLLTMLLALAYAGPCQAGLFDRYPEVYPNSDKPVLVKLQQGWFDDELTWFTCTDANDIRTVQTAVKSNSFFSRSLEKITLAPKLDSALGTSAATMYVICNYSQGPVFTTAPTEDDYTPLWNVKFVTWNNINDARPITNAYPAGEDNPTGLPDECEATITCTGIVMDCPILAIGQLGGPWYPGPEGTYRIPQGIWHDPYSKLLLLPSFRVYCPKDVSNKVKTVRVIIPDVGDAALASVLGANVAPRLLATPLSDTQRFWVMRCPKPSGQLPIIEDCPTKRSWRNSNYDYSPIMQYTILQRYIPASTVVNNPDYIKLLQSNDGLVTIKEDQLINAPVVRLIDLMDLLRGIMYYKDVDVQ